MEVRATVPSSDNPRVKRVGQDTGKALSPVNDDLAYFRRMKVEPTPYGIIRWIERKQAKDGEFDYKYARRLIEALVQLCGGDIDIAYRHGNDTQFEE